MNIKSVKLAAASFFIVLFLIGCGQKGPLIVDRPADATPDSQEGLPNEISPSDGSESESEEEPEIEAQETPDESSDSDSN